MRVHTTPPNASCPEPTVILEFSVSDIIALRGGEMLSTFSGSGVSYGDGVIDGFEAFILAAFCAGMDFHDPVFMAALESAYDAVCNHQ